MEDLDFSTLTDDQLVGLLRALLRECVTRGGAVQAAAHSAGLDEAERARIAAEAAQREAAKIRARERERVAREAAEAVQRQHAAEADVVEAARTAERQKAEAERRQNEKDAAAQAAREAVRTSEERDARRKAWLRRAADLVGRHPSEVTIVRAETLKGWRVLVNGGGCNRYGRDHLIDYYPNLALVHTTRALIAKKSAAVLFGAEFWAVAPEVEFAYYGSEYQWEEESVA